MNDAIRTMLERYTCRTQDDYINALREIIQEIALLGLWRAKFFEHAAFYGGTALRVLHGLDRFSEDLDFSLLKPDVTFRWAPYGDALCRELRSFGFDVEFETQHKPTKVIESAFLKANTLTQLLVIESGQSVFRDLHPGRVLKVKLEVDTQPPPGFETESSYLLHPIPFAVRAYSLPDLFAGKMHAVLCRAWKTRVKGRDWYDLVWYVSKHPALHLRHLEQRMRQSGHYTEKAVLSPQGFRELLQQRIDTLNVEQIRTEVSPFIKDRHALDVWSQDFFRSLVDRIQIKQ